MAVVVTYCRRSPHDRYFFDDPAAAPGRGNRGSDLQPAQSADGRQAYSLGHPLRVAAAVASRQGNGRARRVRKIIKGLFPVFIRNYLLDEENHFRQTPTEHGTLGGVAGVR